jgi:hypothetical protein
MMKVAQCMENDSMHKKANTPQVLQLTMRMIIKNVVQTASGPKRGQKGNGIRTHLRTKGLWWKRSHRMLSQCDVSIMRSWVTSLKPTKR